MLRAVTLDLYDVFQRSCHLCHQFNIFFNELVTESMDFLFCVQTITVNYLRSTCCFWINFFSTIFPASNISWLHKHLTLLPTT